MAPCTRRWLAAVAATALFSWRKAEAGSGTNGLGPNGEDVWCETEVECGETDYIAMPGGGPFAGQFVDYHIVPEDGYMNGAVWKLTGGENGAVMVPDLAKSWISWQHGSTRAKEGANPDDCSGVAVLTAPDGEEVARTDTDNTFQMDINAPGIYTLSVELTDACEYWHTAIVYHAVHDPNPTTTSTQMQSTVPTTDGSSTTQMQSTVPTTDGSSTTQMQSTVPTTQMQSTVPTTVASTTTTTTTPKPIEICEDGDFALELMVHVEDSFQMHATGALFAVANELPPLIDQLASSFTKGVKVGFTGYGDKQVEPHGQPNVDYCLGHEVGLFHQLSADPADEISAVVTKMSDNPKSGRDSMEDLFGSLSHIALSTPWSPSNVVDGARVLRVNLAIVEKLWHEEGDSSHCECKDDKWSEYDCLEWSCSAAKDLPKHPGTAASGAGFCHEHDYLSRSKMGDILKETGNDVLIYSVAAADPTVLEAYKSLGDYMRSVKGVGMYEAGPDGRSVLKSIQSMLDRLCKRKHQEDEEKEKICEEPGAKMFDAFSEENDAIYAPGFVATKLREAYRSVYPKQPFLLEA